MKRLLASFALVSALALSAAALAQTTLYQTLINVATGTTGAVTATLAANAGKTTWICGFDVSAIGGTNGLVLLHRPWPAPDIIAGKPKFRSLTRKIASRYPLIVRSVLPGAARTDVSR